MKLKPQPQPSPKRVQSLKQLTSESLSQFELINPNAAGIDLGASEHWVSVPTDRDEQSVRRFSCFTADLYALADWLQNCGIETVAMEATGVYWIPVFQILETRGFEVKLVNAYYARMVPGRKSDILDCQWLQKLHSCGLLSGSFRPDDEVCVLRSYIRQRDNLIRSSSTHVLRMQKALIQMNLQLHRVLSDITGVTGLAIIRAILAGEHRPEVLAQLKHPRTQRSTSEIAAALTGDYRREHLFVLQQELALWEFYQAQIAVCDTQIEQYLNELTAKVDLDVSPLPKPKRGQRNSGNAPMFDLRTHLYRISGVDFTSIDGLGVLTVQTILSEVGLDPSRFPTVKHFTSWLGLCPGSRISGGKVISSRTRRVASRAAQAFRLAAQCLRTSPSALGAFYRRMRSRLGPPKATTATAYKLARLFYHFWTRGGEYADPGANYYEQQYQERMVKHLKKKAQALGFDLVPQTPLTENVS